MRLRPSDAVIRAPRFRETGKGSFLGDLVYDRVVPQDHFLRKLNEMVDWKPFINIWRDTTKGERDGPRPYESTLILKMLLLSYLCDFSEQQTEDLVNFQLPAKWFVGLAVDESAPDHATLSLFKGRLLAQKGEKVFQELIKGALKIASTLSVQMLH